MGRWLVPPFPLCFWASKPEKRGLERSLGIGCVVLVYCQCPVWGLVALTLLLRDFAF